MSVTKRLFNLARAEIGGVLHKLSDPVEALRERKREREVAEEIERSSTARSAPSAKPEPEAPREKPRRRGAPPDDAQVRRFYANLELPIGAGPDEVRAAYRRMMKRYHPDHHHSDPEKARVATQLSQELRAAYEGLLQHLSR